MFTSVPQLGFLLLGILPLAGFVWAVRRPGMTRGRVLGVTMLAGLTVGVGLTIVQLITAPPLRGELDDTLYFSALVTLWYTLFAGALGLAGLLLRTLGQWLAGRP